MFRRSGVVPQLGTLPTLVLGALLIVALFHTLPGIFSGGGRPRAAQLLETSAQPSVAASARRGNPAAVAAKPAACGSWTPHHQPFKALLDADLCRRLDAWGRASPFMRCPAGPFVAVGASKGERPGQLCSPMGAALQVLQGVVQGLPCSAHTCCDVLAVFRKGTRDCGVFQQVFQMHFYRLLYPLAQKGIFSPKYVLDAGGNAGFSTLMFKLLWPEAVVVGLEPDQDNFEIFQRNTAWLQGVHTLNAGLWGHRARLAAVEAKTESWGRVFKEVDLDAAGGVDAYGVQDVAAKFGIPAFEFVKIDVEGAEGRVFQEGEDLSWLDSVQLVVMEVHPGNRAHFGLKELTPQIVAALSGTKQRLVGAADGEHLFFLREDLLQRLQAESLTANEGA